MPTTPADVPKSTNAAKPSNAAEPLMLQICYATDALALSQGSGVCK